MLAWRVSLCVIHPMHSSLLIRSLQVGTANMCCHAALHHWQASLQRSVDVTSTVVLKQQNSFPDLGLLSKFLLAFHRIQNSGLLLRTFHCRSGTWVQMWVPLLKHGSDIDWPLQTGSQMIMCTTATHTSFPSTWRNRILHGACDLCHDCFVCAPCSKCYADFCLRWLRERWISLWKSRVSFHGKTLDSSMTTTRTNLVRTLCVLLLLYSVLNCRDYVPSVHSSLSCLALRYPSTSLKQEFWWSHYISYHDLKMCPMVLFVLHTSCTTRMHNGLLSYKFLCFTSSLQSWSALIGGEQCIALSGDLLLLWSSLQTLSDTRMDC